MTKYLGFRHGGGTITACIDDDEWDSENCTYRHNPVFIEDMTPKRARALAEDLIRRADELERFD